MCFCLFNFPVCKLTMQDLYFSLYSVSSLFTFPLAIESYFLFMFSVYYYMLYEITQFVLVELGFLHGLEIHYSLQKKLEQVMYLLKSVLSIRRHHCMGKWSHVAVVLHWSLLSSQKYFRSKHPFKFPKNGCGMGFSREALISLSPTDCWWDWCGHPSIFSLLASSNTPRCLLGKESATWVVPSWDCAAGLDACTSQFISS